LSLKLSKQAKISARRTHLTYDGRGLRNYLAVVLFCTDGQFRNYAETGFEGSPHERQEDAESFPNRTSGSEYPASTAGLVLGSVQLAFARQDAKEHGESDDGWRRLDDSYSPRRHWCSSFKPDGEAWVRGLRTDV
jgi:hypothetical protein